MITIITITVGYVPDAAASPIIIHNSLIILETLLVVYRDIIISSVTNTIVKPFDGPEDSPLLLHCSVPLSQDNEPSEPTATELQAELHVSEIGANCM